MWRSLPMARTTTSPEFNPTRMRIVTPFAAHAVRVARHRRLHPKRRVACSKRVILVRNRCAEQRHDPVAHHPVHGALVPVDGLHHVLDDGVEELARLLW